MKTKALLRNKAFIIFYLVIIFVAPPVFIGLEIIPKTPITNLITLIGCTLGCLAIMTAEGWKWEDYDTKPKEGADMYYLTFTLYGIIFVIIMKEILSLKVNLEVLNRPYFLALFMPICFMQVLTYNVFLIKKLMIFTENRATIVFIRTLIFSGMHLIFSFEFFIICLFGGVGFTYVYLAHPNIKRMWFSHSTLNFTVALLGAFSPQ